MLALATIAMVKIVYDVDEISAIELMPKKYLPGSRRGSKYRHRISFEFTTGHFSELEFQHAFRFSRTSFKKLVGMLLTALIRDRS